MAALSISILSLVFINNIVDDISVELKGNLYFSSNYIMKFYKPFKNRQDIEIFIKKILDLYANAGFPFCSINPEFVDTDSIKKRLILHINEGEQIIIKDYIFKTDGKTDTGPLKKIACVKENQLFSLNDLNRAKKSILRTGVFNNISATILKKENDYYLYFELKEKPTDYIMAGGSFAQTDNYLTVEFYSLNIFGTLRHFQFHYESNIFLRKINKKIFNINFTEPILLSPVTFNAELQLWTYDSARLTELNINFNAPLSDYYRIILSSGIEMANYLTDTGSYNYTHTLLGIGFQANFYVGNFKLLNSVKSDYLIRENKRIRFLYDGIIEYKNLFFKPHYCLVKTKSFVYLDYHRLGGVKNLRGYMEDEFMVKEAFWLNIEYRKLPIYPLFDIAWFEKKYTYSYGVGIDAKTNLVNTSVIFAMPENGTWTDTKVHILLEKSL
ncbi:MAG: hypothetical protein ABIL46_06510 [candidate division WOR-3 bacterium]